MAGQLAAAQRLFSLNPVRSKIVVSVSRVCELVCLRAPMTQEENIAWSKLSDKKLDTFKQNLKITFLNTSNIFFRTLFSYYCIFTRQIRVNRNPHFFVTRALGSDLPN